MRKSELIDIIYDVEIQAGYANMSALELYEEINKKLNSQEIDNIISGLRRGIPKSKIYEPYLPEDAHLIVIYAERMSIPVYRVLEEVKRSREKLLKIQNKLKSNIIMPSVTYIAVSIAAYIFLMRMGNTISNSGIIPPPHYLQFLKVWYFPIVLGFLGIFFYFVAINPYRTPGISKIVLEIEGLRMMINIRLFYMTSISVPVMIEYAMSTTRGKIRKAFEELYYKKANTMDEFLDGFLSLLPLTQVMTLKNAFRTGKFIETLTDMISRKEDNLDVVAESISAVFSVISLVLIAFPVMMVLIPYIMMVTEMTTTIMSKMTSGGV